MLDISEVNKGVKLPEVQLEVRSDIKIQVINLINHSTQRLTFDGEGKGICMIFNYGKMFCLEQSCYTYEINNRQCNVFTIDSEQDTLYIENKGDYLLYVITFPHSVLDSLLYYFDSSSTSFMMNHPIRRMFQTNLFCDREVTEHLHKLDQIDLNVGLTTAEVFGRLLLILSQLFAQEKAQHEIATREADLISEERILRVYLIERILRNDFSRVYTLNELAKISGTNECYLKHDFKATFGLPIHTYQRKIKMELAHDMLINTTKSIYTISKFLGYKHASHFNFAFRRYYGATPGEVRAKVCFTTQ